MAYCFYFPVLTCLNKGFVSCNGCAPCNIEIICLFLTKPSRLCLQKGKYTCWYVSTSLDKWNGYGYYICYIYTYKYILVYMKACVPVVTHYKRACTYVHEAQGFNMVLADSC